MTKVTIITEYTDSEGTKVVSAQNDLGFNGVLQFKNDEAEIFIRAPGEQEGTRWNEHPDDAMMQFLDQFFEF